MTDKALMQADVARINKAGEKELIEVDARRIAQDQFTDHMAFFQRLVGRSQALSTIREITNVLDFSQLAQFKDSKGYRAWKDQKTPNGLVFSGTWKDFCIEFLGKSEVTIDAGIDNVKSFGSEAVESMQRLGISARKFAELRRLPEDEKTALTEASKSDDKDSFLDLAESLISKHSKEKEAAEQREQTLRQSIDASNNVSEAKNKQIQTLAEEIEQLKGNITEGEASPLVREIESDKAQAFIPLMRLKNRALIMEGKLNDSGKVDRAEYFALQAALDTLRDEMAQAMDAIYNAGAPFQASIASASLAQEDNSAGIN